MNSDFLILFYFYYYYYYHHFVALNRSRFLGPRLRLQEHLAASLVPQKESPFGMYSS